MPIHSGSCHCGAVRFEVNADIDHVRACDCSICSKRGLLTFRVRRDALRLLTPWETMTVYEWGTRTAEDHFCRTCGVLPFRKPSRPTPEETARGVTPFDGWAINVRCIETIDLATLPRVVVEGRRLSI